MSCLQYRGNQLYIEDVSLKNVADEFGTPCYIYSRSAIEANWHTFDEAFSGIPHRICYAVKANSNIAILHLLARLNSGFDIVSMGEIDRVIAAGGDPKKIVFSGVGKKRDEIEHAIEKKIYCFNIESEPELERLQEIAARMNAAIDVAIRINPNINPHTHSHITTGLNESKFGIDITDVIPLAQKISRSGSLRLVGIASHIGSQIVQLAPFLEVVDRLLDTYQQLLKIGITLRHINIGGGLGITYHDEHPPGIREYARALQDKLRPYNIEVIIEPGRAIVGNAGILLSRIEYLKHTQHKNFAIIDAGMNDLLRPALYDAWQNILPVELHNSEVKQYDIAGPVCESADFLGKNRDLALQSGDLLAIDSSGAYGFSMSSNYNSRCRPPEILVDGSNASLIRRRETIKDLFAAEIIADLAPCD
ncbi:Diaminopimelate decarboxylase [Aquicella siphonis]|uniref:Diaminopimelate decarboxylase n=1 Tax=Aquicella siphonis TaxID=254247 RepID=A0A5E4PLU4_9COXI|nr:diaminopimelate decarboxylase [Aquicella siphonis]VVC77273.1 Diaminopimelate decarboxylase [Aquicella siphonis]